jgi:hypothetical protein
VIGTDNIWVNVQEFDDPGLLNYNLDIGGNWRSFFHKSSNYLKYLQQGTPEQPPQLQYMRPMDSDRADIIALKI